jgi:hypothetical protein
MSGVIREELDRIREATGADGLDLIRAEDVVEFARDAGAYPALHSRLDWDDATAGHAWRLHQARNLIRVTVTVLPSGNEPVRAFVSLTTDRRAEGGGYRSLPSVLSDGERRRQMLADAFAELAVVRRKYATLAELAAVFEAIDAAAAKVNPGGKPKRPRPKGERPAARPTA